ncbi:unnamed protein product [Zymoseptoria tritici ST99CH_1A5]|uniref:Uncharacterized protein n=1 Tax=Zymoseptoria tritici ST99CH_1A5 TaxID=1276529 RepID=A0A1Y6LSV2_ZYMTR|nr:unnamed protein product [Zymoseptoria tritici ST99CH_3D1]SMY26488.1 unnamed protein product [Zymoseptoria tritici ST99CH_1A5]
MSPTVETIGNALLAISALALIITLCTIASPSTMHLYSARSRASQAIPALNRRLYGPDTGRDTVTTGHEGLEAARRGMREYRAIRERRAVEAEEEDLVAYLANVRRPEDGEA